jgi:predicted HAD superfamily Cof-like phosphohydrolase
MNKEWEAVKLFHETFGHPAPNMPKMIDGKRARSRGTWMLEETAEFLTASDIYEQADAMIDLIYFALGTLVEMGIKPDELFNAVQQANMSKIWEDGKPRFNNKDGKVIKPANWEDPKPKLKAIIDDLMK